MIKTSHIQLLHVSHKEPSHMAKQEANIISRRSAKDEYLGIVDANCEMIAE